MRPAVLLLIGVVLGGLVGYLIFGPGRNPAGDSMLMIQTLGDTVIINAKKDTVIINAKKDTIIINAITWDYCDRTPRPKWCPPVTN